MNLQTFMSAISQRIPKVKLWILRLVFASGLSLFLENQVTTTPDTFALCTHSPSTLASLGVHLFSLNIQDKTMAFFEFSFGGVSLILENLVFCVHLFYTFPTSNHELTHLHVCKISTNS